MAARSDMNTLGVFSYPGSVDVGADYVAVQDSECFLRAIPRHLFAFFSCSLRLCKCEAHSSVLSGCAEGLKCTLQCVC
jgi:hypothetical protein